MQIFIKLPSGKVCTIEVRQEDKIEAVKNKIFDKTQTPPERISLKFHERELINEHTVGSYGIKHEDTMYMRVIQDNEIEIKVDYAGEKYCFHIVSTYTVLSLKSEIERVVNIPPERQRLKFKNAVLEDEEATLEEHEIGKDSVINLDEKLQVFISADKKHQICVHSNDTIQQLKKEIERVTRIKPGSQKIVYGNQMISNDDSQTLRDIEFISGGELQVGSLFDGGYFDF